MGHAVELYFPEAPNGSFAVTSYGESASNPGVFTDYECTQATTARSLTALGRAYFFVTELVTITIRDANGNPVATRVAGVRDAAVAVVSPAFTGAIANGGQAAGGLTHLPDAFEDLLDSFGATDFRVRETGTAVDLKLKDALAAVRQTNARVFNVKAAPFNAVGDGITFDDVPVLAAVAAAKAAGGGTVYFPAGTYLLSQTIVIDGAVVIRLVGDGSGELVAVSTRIQSGNSTAAISVSSAAVIEDMEIRVTSANARPITSVAATSLRCRNLAFTTVGGTDCPVDVTGSATFDQCTFVNIGTTASLIAQADASSRLRVFNCAFSINSPSAIRILNQWSSVIGCDFPSDNSTAKVSIGTASVHPRHSVVGCRADLFSAGRSFIRLSTDTSVHERGNVAHTSTGTMVGDLVHLDISPHTGKIISDSRPFFTAGAAASLTPSYNYARIYQDANANWTLNAAVDSAAAAATPFDGQEIEIWVRNSTGGAITITLNAQYHGTTTNLAAGNTRVYRFKFKASGSLTGFIQQGAIVDLT